MRDYVLRISEYYKKKVYLF